MSAKQFPDYLLQESRNVVALFCRNLIMKKAESDKIASQELKMEKVFHGSSGHASAMKEFVNGKGHYEHVFAEKELENDRDGNDKRADGRMLEMVNIFSCDESAVPTVHERGFTLEALCHNRNREGDLVTVQGRNINERALSTVATLKFAHEFQEEWLSTAGEVPPGKKFEDVVLCVRQKMFVGLRGKKNPASVKRAKETSPLTEDDVPSKRVFTGYFAFLLLGKHGLAGENLECLTSDGKDVKKVGRSETRANAAEVKGKERNANDRGIPLAEQVSVAQLSAAQLRDAKQNVRELVALTNANHASALKELELVNGILKGADDDASDAFQCYTWRRRVMSRLDAIDTRKTELEEESNRPLRMVTNRPVQSLYENVGAQDSEVQVIHAKPPSSNAGESVISPLPSTVTTSEMNNKNDEDC